MSRVQLDDRISPANQPHGIAGTATDSRLVAVSRRVPKPGACESCGGVAVVLADLLGARGGLWFGWNGETDGEAARPMPALRRVGEVEVAGLDLTAEERRGLDNGFADNCLRPALHFQLGLMRYCPQAHADYLAVNRRFAAALNPLLRPGDRVTIHDFHCMPMAEALRAQGWDGPIGFFLHTPFPPPEIVAAVPGHEELIRALMHSDLIGFQSWSDRHNFADYVERHLGGRNLVDRRLQWAGPGRPLAAAFPMGIDVDAVTRAAGAAPPARRDRARSDRIRTVIGVDALDCSKGIPERLRAFERFLELYPEHHGRVQLVQIVRPATGEAPHLAGLARTIEQLVGHINGRFGTFSWTPVHSVHRCVPRRRLMALLREASIGLVTPVRDGMNLVAKEYVAAQDPDLPGVLVLSRFAGAAEELRAALLINPADADAIADTLDRALHMPPAERRSRHRWLYSQVQRNDISVWRAKFLEALDSVSDTGHDIVKPIMAGAA